MDPKKKQLFTEEEFEKDLPEKWNPLADTDLARDNIENDFPRADLQDY